MADQALAFHRLSDRRYDLSRVRTGNVRDQLLRSTLVVNALRGRALIGRGKLQSLLVFGAGAAGINAAILAAKQGVRVVVIEAMPHMFATVSGSWWRRVCPTEYDWPHEHWKSGAFPRNGGAGLTQRSRTGAALAAAWKAEWGAAQALLNGTGKFGSVKVLPNADANQFKVVEHPTHLEVTGPWGGGGATQTTEEFGALLSCVGVGVEQVSEVPLNGMWGGYVGPGFWTDSDGIAAGLPLPTGVTDVLVSGGGDGAMQDLQRVTTSLFGRQLYELIESLASSAGLASLLPSEAILLKLLSAEDAGRRAFSWAPDRFGVPVALAEWHSAFRTAVARYLSSMHSNERHQLAKKIFRRELFSGDLRVTWITREPTPGYAYALNRFLATLVLELATYELPRDVIRYLPNSSIYSIAAAGSSSHVCGDPAVCSGQDHDVVLNVASSARQVAMIANLIIVRHGVEPRSGLSQGAPIPEQMVPYDIPR